MCYLTAGTGLIYICELIYMTEKGKWLCDSMGKAGRMFLKKSSSNFEAKIAQLDTACNTQASSCTAAADIRGDKSDSLTQE